MPETRRHSLQVGPPGHSRVAPLAGVAAAVLVATGFGLPEAMAQPGPFGGRNCALAAPPAGAGEVSNAETLIKVYPRAADLSAAYAGCQSAWVGRGDRWTLVVRILFESGQPRAIWSPGDPPGAPRCRYDGKGLVDGAPEQCPEPGQLILRSLPAGCVERSRSAGGLASGCAYD
jgi:hypothetical protein